ncbi:TetR/AcrR family transcriptional regulator [Streptomyces sp. B1I3]|uniref:TetR/AcrR family transcriptional regulator n=1 Tax=Streptomyces sp. B1I3 TaxID=3042264 RepID=UPI00278B7E9F|nr:TetR/AcrR family transcriptional regulator [Streptomyces sp. B1I3]MDQ0793516.1 AcrR family transcriptional regulator [Streptomyces sp. B1I3]
MTASQPTASARPRSMSLRRRGPVLERAILDAALEQLGTVGWNGLTMEGVAAGARTGKAAVYRRWPSKEDLVADALRAGLPALDEVPDSGGVRDDLYEMCRRVRDALWSAPGIALRSVLHECDATTAERFHAVILSGMVEPATQVVREVLRRGVERGEVRPDALSAMVVDVIPAIMMYRTKVCGSEWTDGEIAQMIDEVGMPLFRV